MNGVAERCNRTHGEMARAMLLTAQRQPHWWYHAIQCATYIANRLPSKGNPMSASPFQALYGQLPDLSHLKVWGCPAYCIKDAKPGLTRMKSRSCMFVAYTAERITKAQHKLYQRILKRKSIYRVRIRVC